MMRFQRRDSLSLGFRPQVSVQLVSSLCLLNLVEDIVFMVDRRLIGDE